MAYITLEELKEILPEIMRDWIDKDDESWEWIFQEIEQKCHIGKRCKGKKWRKKLDSMVETHSTVLFAHRNDINELSKKVDELTKYATDNLSSRINTLGDKYTVLTNRVNTINRDVNAAKSMAETAKQRTEVDYSKYSGKSDGKISYCNTNDKDCKTCKYYCDAEAIKEPCNTCDAYQCWEAKENDHSRSYNECVSCKYMLKGPTEQPCVGCRYNGINNSGIDKWEAKDE